MVRVVGSIAVTTLGTNASATSHLVKFLKNEDGPTAVEDAVMLGL